MLRSTLSRAAKSSVVHDGRSAPRFSHLESRHSYFLDPRYVVHTALANVCDVC